MSQILGLVTGQTFSTNEYHKRNARRRVFHDNPTGAAPLTGLLSLMETEHVDAADDFGWWEKRFDEPNSLCENGTTGAVHKIADGTTHAGDTFAFDYDATDNTSSPYSQVVVNVVDAAKFRERHVVMLLNVPLEAGGTTTVKAVVTAVDYTNNKLSLRVLEDSATLTNEADEWDAVDVYVIGNANQEGATSSTGTFRKPIKPTNNTQIFRNAFSFTRTALKLPAEFDSTGIYKEKAKDNAVDHMVEMEKAFIWGTKGVQYIEVDGETLPERTTGGVIYFLQQWEAANSIYRGGTGAAAVTAVTDDNKRIISSTSGTITWKNWLGYLERAFRVTNNKSFEKLFLCGNGMLAAVNEALEQRVVKNATITAQSVYGMNIVTWETPFGTVHFKTHPLFNRNAVWRNSGLLLDVQNLRYRPLNDSDTVLLKNRQANDADRRKDEWLTECGLELRFPESHMYFENVQNITV